MIRQESHAINDSSSPGSPADLGGEEEVTVVLVRIGAGLWGPGGEVAVCAGAGPRPRARPEVEMQDGDVVSCGVKGKDMSEGKDKG